MNAGYPLGFNSARKQFNDKLSEKCNGEDDYILLPDFFEVKSRSFEAKQTSKRFLRKIHRLANDSYESKIRWITKKIIFFFVERVKIRSRLAICTKEYVQVKRIILIKLNEILKLDRKKNPTHAFIRNVYWLNLLMIV